MPVSSRGQSGHPHPSSTGIITVLATARLSPPTTLIHLLWSLIRRGLLGIAVSSGEDKLNGWCPGGSLDPCCASRMMLAWFSGNEGYRRMRFSMMDLPDGSSHVASAPLSIRVWNTLTDALPSLPRAGKWREWAVLLGSPQEFGSAPAPSSTFMHST